MGTTGPVVDRPGHRRGPTGCASRSSRSRDLVTRAPRARSPTWASSGRSRRSAARWAACRRSSGRSTPPGELGSAHHDLRQQPPLGPEHRLLGRRPRGDHERSGLPRRRLLRRRRPPGPRPRGGADDGPHHLPLARSRCAASSAAGCRTATRRAFGFDVDFQVESYLQHQGASVPEALRRQQLPLPDPGDGLLRRLRRPGRHRARRSPAPPTRFLVVSFDSDWRFDTAHSREIVRTLAAHGAPVTFREIPSPHGHDSFLLEIPEYHRTVAAFLDRVRDGATARPRVRRRPRRRGRPWSRRVAGARPGLRRRRPARRADRRARLPRAGRGASRRTRSTRASRAASRWCRPTSTRGCRTSRTAAFDVVVLSQTLQATHRPARVLREMMRVGRVGDGLVPELRPLAPPAAPACDGADAGQPRRCRTPGTRRPTSTSARSRDFEELARAEGLWCGSAACSTPTGGRRPGGAPAPQPAGRRRRVRRRAGRRAPPSPPRPRFSRRRFERQWIHGRQGRRRGRPPRRRSDGGVRESARPLRWRRRSGRPAPPGPARPAGSRTPRSRR